MKDAKMFIIEDELTSAYGYYEDIDIEDVVPNVTFVDSLKAVEATTFDTNYHHIFWVDIQLGPGKDRDGIRAIDSIRKRNEHALIIVYSAYSQYETECIDAGANHFFVKERYHSTMKKINEIVLNDLYSNALLIDISNFVAEISNIDDENQIVKLRCKINGKYIDKYFPLNRISTSIGTEDLKRGEFLHVRIIVKKLNTNFVFKLLATSPDDFYNKGAESDDIDLSNSEIWKS